MSSNDPNLSQSSGQQTAPSSVPHTPGLQMPGSAVTPGATNNLAIVSLIAGAFSFFAHIIPIVGGFTVAIIAIVTGVMARGQIRRTGESGMWMANLGIALGIIHFVLAFLLVMLVLFLIFVVGIALFGISSHGGVTVTPVPS